MEKITKSSDKVLIDPNEPLILPDGTALVGRIEWFLYALCCLDYQNLPTPMSRIEEFANALITGEIPNIEPQSRAEQFFLAILDGNVSNLPQPQSRSEVLLDKLARGEFDLSDVEPIQSHYELLLAYLIKNGGIDNIDYVLYEFSEAMKTMYNTVEKPFKSLELSGNTLVNCVLEDTENDDYTSFDKDYNGTSFAINGTSEGAIKSAILKGQTLVNCLKSKSGNYSEYQISATYDYDLLKPNTVYTFVNKWDKGGTLAIVDDKGVITNINFMKNSSVLFTSPATIVNIEIYSVNMIHGGTQADCEKWKSSFMIIEGDRTNQDIPYFEGMASVKLPVLTTIGKNLWDKKNFVNGVIDGESIRVSASDLDDTRFYYDFKENQQYVFTLTSYSENKKLVYFRYNYTDGTDSGFTNFLPYNGERKHFLSDEGKTISYISFVFSNHDNYTLSNIQLEEGNVATSYEPFKSNILTVNEEVELRGIGEVRDTLDLLTGEIVQSIGEIVLDGSEDEKWTFHEGYDIFICEDLVYNENYLSTHVLSKTTWGGIERFDLTPSHYGITSASSGREYLSNNPITIQYQLATESIKTVDLNVVDQNNTKIDKIHVFNETTHVNASSDELTPTVNIGKSVSYPTIIKPNTKYTVDLKRNDKPLTVNLGGTEVTFVDGETRKTITTPSTLTNDKLSYYGVGAKCNEIMLIEGEIERNVDYFTGMQSVVMQNQMPILKTVGKNLLNDNTSVSGWIMEDGRTTIRGALGSGSDYLSDFIYVGNINQIKISRGCYVTTFDENKKIISQFVNVVDANVSNCSYIRIAVSCNAQVALGLVGTIQVEEGSVATSYEPHKSSILSCNEDVVLRGIGDVQDTLDCLTGELIQRVVEYSFNGDNFKTIVGQLSNNDAYAGTKEKTTIFRFQDYNTPKAIKRGKIISNLFSYNAELWGMDVEGICCVENSIDIRILKSRLNGYNDDLDANAKIELFKTWLNNVGGITVQCEPYYENIIETVDLRVVNQDGNTIPKIKSYNDVTHLEVTVPKQSLLPHISAEVATDNSKDMSSLTTKHQEISEAQSVIQDNIQSQSDEIDTALMATTEIFESILE